MKVLESVFAKEGQTAVSIWQAFLTQMETATKATRDAMEYVSGLMAPNGPFMLEARRKALAGAPADIERYLALSVQHQESANFHSVLNATRDEIEMSCMRSAADLFGAAIDDLQAQIRSEIDDLRKSEKERSARIGMNVHSGASDELEAKIQALTSARQIYGRDPRRARSQVKAIIGRKF